MKSPPCFILLRSQTIDAYRDIDTRDHLDAVELKIAAIGVKAVSKELIKVYHKGK